MSTAATRSERERRDRTRGEPGRREHLLRARDRPRAAPPTSARDLARVGPPVPGHERDDRRAVAQRARAT